MAKQPKMITCKNCGKEIPENLKLCPSCGAKNKKPFFQRWWFWLIVDVLVLGIAGGSQSNSPADQSPSLTTSQSEINANSSSNQESLAASSDAKLSSKKNDDSINESVPTEYRSTLKKAKTYSDMMHMSKAQIHNQLVSEYGEKFSLEAADYAMAHLQVDWNQNALEKAKTYSKTMNMSQAAILDQLTSEYGEQFTQEEAQYAMDHLEADWNQNALESAKVYQDTMNMSPAAIYDQLVSDYGGKFTPEQAQYAIDHLN